MPSLTKEEWNDTHIQNMLIQIISMSHLESWQWEWWMLHMQVLIFRNGMDNIQFGLIMHFNKIILVKVL